MTKLCILAIPWSFFICLNIFIMVANLGSVWRNPTLSKAWNGSFWKNGSMKKWTLSYLEKLGNFDQFIIVIRCFVFQQIENNIRIISSSWINHLFSQTQPLIHYWIIMQPNGQFGILIHGNSRTLRQIRSNEVGARVIHFRSKTRTHRCRTWRTWIKNGSIPKMDHFEKWNEPFLELRPDVNPPNLSLKVVSELASRTSEVMDFLSFSAWEVEDSPEVLGEPWPLFCELLPELEDPEPLVSLFPLFNLEIKLGNCLANSSSDNWAACWTSCSWLRWDWRES